MARLTALLNRSERRGYRANLPRLPSPPFPETIKAGLKSDEVIHRARQSRLVNPFRHITTSTKPSRQGINKKKSFFHSIESPKMLCLSIPLDAFSHSLTLSLSLVAIFTILLPGRITQRLRNKFLVPGIV
jgi:hypothetical protein